MMVPCTMLLLFLFLGFVSGRSLTIDQIIASATKDETFFDFIGDVSGDVIRLELDMLMPYEQYLSLFDNQSETSTNQTVHHMHKRKAVQKQKYLWPNREIPYSIESSDFLPEETEEILKAIREWEDHTCIRFREAGSDDVSHIHFEDGNGCSSFVGKGKEKQPISLAEECRVTGVIVHEIGHALGFVHEHNRPDRDEYITVQQENMGHPDVYSNFKKYSPQDIDTHGVPYDYKSVMHYGGLAYSANGKYTIVTKDPAYQDVIGRRVGLSFLDIKLANLMYKCSDSCQSPVKCPDEGFLGKDCRCWCPGNPVILCTDSGTTTAQPSVKPAPPGMIPPPNQDTVKPMEVAVSPACVDINTRCPRWSKAGACRYSNMVRTVCRRSCQSCDGHNTGTSVPIVCRDVRSKCGVWSRRGLCKGHYSKFVLRKCPRSCGLCQLDEKKKRKKPKPKITKPKKIGKPKSKKPKVKISKPKKAKTMTGKPKKKTKKATSSKKRG